MLLRKEIIQQSSTTIKQARKTRGLIGKLWWLDVHKSGLVDKYQPDQVNGKPVKILANCKHESKVEISLLP